MRLARLLLVAFLAALPLAAAAGEMPRFGELEKALRLRPEQKDQFDIAVAASQRALLSLALGGMQLKQRLAEELAKPRPDLRALAREEEQMVEQSRPLFRESRDEWLKLFDLLDDDQARIAREFIEEKLARLPKLGLMP